MKPDWVRLPTCGGWWWDNLWERPRAVWTSHTGKPCAVTITGTDTETLEEDAADATPRWWGPIELPPGRAVEARRG